MCVCVCVCGEGVWGDVWVCVRVRAAQEREGWVCVQVEDGGAFGGVAAGSAEERKKRPALLSEPCARNTPKINTDVNVRSRLNRGAEEG